MVDVDGIVCIVCDRCDVRNWDGGIALGLAMDVAYSIYILQRPVFHSHPLSARHGWRRGGMLALLDWFFHAYFGVVGSPL